MNRRRNTVIIVVLVALVAIALVIIGTLTVIGSMDGTVHVDGKATAATSTGGHWNPAGSNSTGVAAHIWIGSTWTGATPTGCPHRVEPAHHA